MMQYKKKNFSKRNMKKITIQKILYIAYFFKKYSYIIKNKNNILIVSIETLYIMKNF